MTGYFRSSGITTILFAVSLAREAVEEMADFVEDFVSGIRHGGGGSSRTMAESSD